LVPGQKARPFEVLANALDAEAEQAIRKTL
jgi:hypothetical protein